MFVEIDAGIPGVRGGVELVLTHLLWGDGWIPFSATWPSPARRRAWRAQQIEELVAFVTRHHRPGRLLILGGDFNVDAIGDPQEAASLRAALAPLGLRDLWDEQRGPGPTADWSGKLAFPRDPDDPERCADTPPDRGPEPRPRPGQTAGAETGLRLDHVYVNEPGPEGVLEVRSVRMDRMVPLRRDHRRPLSDHAALLVNLHLEAPPRSQS